jgi:hypothetical protein
MIFANSLLQFFFTKTTRGAPIDHLIGSKNHYFPTNGWYHRNLMKTHLHDEQAFQLGQF